MSKHTIPVQYENTIPTKRRPRQFPANAYSLFVCSILDRTVEQPAPVNWVPGFSFQKYSMINGIFQIADPDFQLVLYEEGRVWEMAEGSTFVVP
jgi:hypothetical protein